MRLEYLLKESAKNRPTATAVVDSRRSWRYQDLDLLANKLARGLLQLGVSPGDRVGICLEKSGIAIACMQAALRIGAVYVPMDPLGPVARNKKIINDCTISVVITTSKRARCFSDSSPLQPSVLLTDEDEGYIQNSMTWSTIESLSDESINVPNLSVSDLAYILYTSGSTGSPKGVCISHQSSLAFIHWALNEIKPLHSDRFASHAPFYFDLSVFDIYVCLGSGATLYLISELAGRIPSRLVNFVRNNEISIWYSVPSALIAMMDSSLVFTEATTTLRKIIFAGETFPTTQLRKLRAKFIGSDLYNFYGPTETNVCAFYKLDKDVPDKLPIGSACAANELWLQDENGEILPDGKLGEIVVKGSSVFSGYWGKPSARQYQYATGDMAFRRQDGDLVFIGRLDSRVKIRGYRIELGEIESVLCKFNKISHAAVILLNKNDVPKIYACITTHEACSVNEVKSHCAQHLPYYMLADDIVTFPALPLNINGKIDRRKLAYELQTMVQ